MPIEITMPRLSDTMEEGTLIKWRVKQGDAVASGDVLGDVETDKATMELTSYDDGKVAKLLAEEGQTLPVGELILVLAEEGESIEDAAASAGSGGAAGASSKAAGDDDAADRSESETAVAAEAPAGAPTAGSSGETSGGGRVKVSPVARKIAEERGLDLGTIRGSGPDGRIIKRDVLAAAGGNGESAKASAAPASAAPSRAPAAAPVSGAALEAKTIPLSNMRKTIARRLVESKTTVPHFTVTVSAAADRLLTMREEINALLEAEGVKLSVNDLIVRACAIALLRHPVVNSQWSDEGIRQPGTVNIGVAVALPEEKGGGLVVPTLREAHRMTLQTINSETKRLANKAREQGLTIEEMSDGTFTLSNLGMFGVDHFEAIINPPQSAILAVGGAVEKAVVRDGAVTIGREMSLTLSADHRVIDGATGAAFLQTLKGLLEAPAGMLV